MTKEEAAALMIKCIENRGDPEVAHEEADRILLIVLREQGWAVLADLFEKVEKWYA